MTYWGRVDVLDVLDHATGEMRTLCEEAEKFMRERDNILRGVVQLPARVEFCVLLEKGEERVDAFVEACVEAATEREASTGHRADFIVVTAGFWGALLPDLKRALAHAYPRSGDVLFFAGLRVCVLGYVGAQP